MYQRVSTLLHSLLLMIFVGTLSSIVYFFKKEPDGTVAAMFMPTLLTTVSSTVAIPPTVAATPDPNWINIQPGLEKRVLEVYNAQSQLVESVHIWRLDQKYFRMDVDYNETPKSLEAWQKETGAAIVLNGGYYSISNERYFPDGLTIVDGAAVGRSFAGFGGMLAIQQDRAELRWLAQKPYDAYEPLQAALQSFPVLVEPGGRLGFGAERENHVSARRTAIGQDREGRILLIVAPEGYFTLHQFSVYLTESDLNLDIAVNLDGGGSTGILVSNSRELISPTRPLPFVILVYPRSA